MFKALSIKLWGFVLAFGILLALIGYQRKAIKEKDHKIDMLDKEKELREDQDEFEHQHKLEEQKANEELREIAGDIPANDKWDRL